MTQDRNSNKVKVDFCLFDLDGTLVNTIKASEAVWRNLCKEYGVNPEELFKHSHGSKTGEILEKFFPALDNTDNKAVRDLEISMGRDYLDSVFAVPGAKDLLQQLNIPSPDTTERKWAIVTSGSHYIAFGWFKSILGDIEKPDVFITAFDVKTGKPDPEGYAKARDQLAEKTCLKTATDQIKTIVFEDAPVGILAGKAMGALTIGITTTFPKDVLFNAGADFVVEDLTHVKMLKNDQNGIVLEINDSLSR
ncbi:HAD family hydrolase NDAI_0C02100 [Naumovozyma dairenensis CBS 421]|uniref:Uncharacterized protein n=1 Tax=Naumovozyma dairenensis (strain ATCC 10597 / BCRC 20456 / CBS 421 / NBRC 0211 / NRRL Y-12639) TaxID=1071378 RepID=G0W7V9_NAUDC|nr:hypothetical protein NDAI_0C02100 [Naumovozyma dairenensis CBS 421]CCD23870.1 hypothetical protein NDAI_0C02100 [Naumovozyma dairenensis CBS 421]